MSSQFFWIPGLQNTAAGRPCQGIGRSMFWMGAPGAVKFWACQVLWQLELMAAAAGTSCANSSYVYEGAALKI